MTLAFDDEHAVDLGRYVEPEEVGSGVGAGSVEERTELCAMMGSDIDECIRRTRIGAGTEVLDLGCGARGSLRRSASPRREHVTGIDAAAGIVEVARERVPDGHFDVGDFQYLPYEDRSLDVVTGSWKRKTLSGS